MKHIKQPIPSNICGQACVAMLNGDALEFILADMGIGKTKSSDLRNHLELHKLGRLTRPTLWRNIHSYPKLCMLRVQWPNLKSHWVIRKGKYIFDPGFKKKVTWQKWYLHIVSVDGKIISYGELKKKKVSIH